MGIIVLALLMFVVWVGIVLDSKRGASSRQGKNITLCSKGICDKCKKKKETIFTNFHGKKLCPKCFDKQLSEEVKKYDIITKEREVNREERYRLEMERINKESLKAQREAKEIALRKERKVNEAREKGICLNCGNPATKLDSDGWCDECEYQCRIYNDDD
ncbi:hypothetical protein KKH39_04425 [Patescibacteria group bacterium]|nr:hypothetical protein [Patescibacteria group bacterium]